MTVSVVAATADDTRALGDRLAALLRAGDLVVLTGDLGAGKTTLTQGIGAGLGVRGGVTSPTFVISRVHPSLVRRPGAGARRRLPARRRSPSSTTSTSTPRWRSRSPSSSGATGLAEELADDRLEVEILARRRADGADAGDGRCAYARGGDAAP